MRVAIFLSSLNDFGSSFNKVFQVGFNFEKLEKTLSNLNGPSLRLQAENTPELIQAFQTFFTQVGLKPYKMRIHKKYAGWKSRKHVHGCHFRKDAWYDWCFDVRLNQG